LTPVALAVLFFVAALAPAQPASAPNVQKTVLDNGLTVLTLEDRALPTITLFLYFKVGSRNEVPGITGISHLFEHMMFNGSEKFAPKVFDRTIEAGGGYSNGSTWPDYTNYWEEFSPAALDSVLEMEADRMRALRLDEQNLEQERGIVINERLFRIDNDVTGLLDERIRANAFIASTYRWSPAGWMEDLQKGIQLDDAKRYFKTYYAPNNAVMVLVGDFETAPTLEKVRRLWAAVPSGDPPRPVLDPEPVQRGEKRVRVYKEAQSPSVWVAYKIPGFLGARKADLPALEVLGVLLSQGRSSPLYQRLVEQSQLATGVFNDTPSHAMTSLTIYAAELAPGKDVARAEREIEAVLQRARDGKLTDAELSRAKNQIEAAFQRGFVGNAGRGQALGYYEAIRGDWKAMYTVLDAYRATTLADLHRVAKTYLVPESRTVAILVPEEPKDAVDFSEAAKPPEEPAPKGGAR
jgi:predicted Zn-dependent peptidase